jgi:cytochrome b pre-mRNA-processing protein 3
MRRQHRGTLLSFLARLFEGKSQRARFRPLYAAIVARGREPGWYREGQVPDTLDGRFDMIAAILAYVLLRLEEEGGDARGDAVLLTELFIDDMDGSLRQIGVGDLMVGKHVGRMMSALGGRLSAFRAAFADGDSLEEAVTRNVFHDAPPSDAALAYVAGRLRALHAALAAAPADRLLAGELPRA